MLNISNAEQHIQLVSTFEELVSFPMRGELNAVCWERELTGDFSEIVSRIEFEGNMTIVEPEELLELELSKEGQLARGIILNDLKLLEDYGASPILNVIREYERDGSVPFFPTDVYSFHMDRSPIPVDTFLCTYYGDASELLHNAQAEQKVIIPEIRAKLQQLYEGPDSGFEDFLSEYFFDLHYEPKPDACLVNLGTGHLWRLATDHPGNVSLPCIHRAPMEKSGQPRLLLIC